MWGLGVGGEPCGTRLCKSTSPCVEPPPPVDIDLGPRSTVTSASLLLGRIPSRACEGTPFVRFEGNGGSGTSRTRPDGAMPTAHRRFGGTGRPVGTRNWQDGNCPRFAGDCANPSEPFGRSSGVSVGQVRTLGRPGSSPSDRSTPNWTSMGRDVRATLRSRPGTRDYLLVRGPRLVSCPHITEAPVLATREGVYGRKVHVSH